EVHSSALDDPLLDHIHFPVEQSRAVVGGHWLPAHSGRFVPAYLAAHLAKHHQRPLLWGLDFYSLWSKLDSGEQRDATVAAREIGLERHLQWAVEVAASIGACGNDLILAEPALHRLERNLATSGNGGRL